MACPALGYARGLCPARTRPKGQCQWVAGALGSRIRVRPLGQFAPLAAGVGARRALQCAAPAGQFWVRTASRLRADYTKGILGQYTKGINTRGETASPLRGRAQSMPLVYLLVGWGPSLKGEALGTAVAVGRERFNLLAQPSSQ